MKYEAVIELAVPPEHVFPFVADPKFRQAWMQKGFGGRYVMLTTEYPNGFDEEHAVGTKFVDVMARQYTQAEARYPGEIIRYSKPTLFEFRSEVPYGPTWKKGAVSKTRSVTLVTFMLEATPSGTKVTWSMTDETVESFGFLNPLFTFMMQNFMKFTLRSLKTMAEKS